MGYPLQPVHQLLDLDHGIYQHSYSLLDLTALNNQAAQQFADNIQHSLALSRVEHLRTVVDSHLLQNRQNVTYVHHRESTHK